MERRRSRFGTWKSKPSIAHATDLVEHELQLMGATDVIISSNLKLRIDGLPRSGQPNPKDPGIAVYFVRKGHQQVLACDTFDLPGCNLYAIGRTVAALRQMERDGCSEMLERAFTGFKALPERTADREWHDELGVTWPGTAFDEVQAKYRELAKRYHPDIPVTGDAARFDRIQRAWSTYNRLCVNGI